MKSTYSQSQRHRFSIGKRTLLTAIGLLVIVLLSAFVWNANDPAEVSQVAAASHEFFKCDTDEQTTVFDLNDRCLRLEVYAPSVPERLLWYDPQGTQTQVCDETCIIAVYHYDGGVLVSVSFFFYISGMGRAPGQYKVEACGDIFCNDILFTDYFTIAFPYQIYLPVVFRNG